MIFTAFGLALSQMTDPRFIRVLLTGVGATLGLLIGFGLLLFHGTGWLVGDTITLPWLGEMQWAASALSWGALLLLMLLSVFLMVPVASAITSLFLDDVADAVEGEHYPHLPQAPRLPFSEALRDTFVFLGVIIGVNLLALILYVIFAPFALFIFWAVNGFLLGREYFTLAAARRVGREGARKLRRKHFGTIWLAGVLMAMPLSVPLFNLLVPILGAATFTHLYHLLVEAKGAPQSVPNHPR
ncbi:MAG: EI24 domain-containing protein [Sulfitobacter sp.]